METLNDLNKINAQIKDIEIVQFIDINWTFFFF